MTVETRAPDEGCVNLTATRRVVQIPLEWPMRCGTVLGVSDDDPPTAILIGWDDGRQEWIENEDLRPLRIWFISEDGTEVEPRPGPLEMQLSRFMGAQPTRSTPSRFPKGHA